MSDGASERDETTRPLLGRSRSSVRPLAFRKPTLRQRQSSTFQYHTFPTAPPRNPGKRASKDPLNAESVASTPPIDPPHRRNESGGSKRTETPLPKRQLAILAVIALCEQTALNSISPYLPEMASTFPEVREGQVGVYVGLIASSFAAAQFATNFAWGWLSDRIGRKPVVLCGTLLTAACFVAFGFCRTLWQAIMVQVMMGLVNGNQGVISTCLGEITDRSNQSKAFTYLPVIYGLGGITGPIVGGLLVMKENPFRPGHANPYPYLLPNLLSAGVLLLDFILTTIFLEESLEEARDLQPLGKRVGNLFTWLWQFTSSHRPTYTRKQQQKPSNPRATSTYDSDGIRHTSNSLPSDTESTASSSWLTKPKENNDADFKSSDVFNRDTILLLLTFLIFQLSNISFNSLYPIFAQGPPPTGRDLNPSEIGISLAFAGLITILFQIGIFGRLRESFGNKATYRTGLAGFIIAFILVPFVGYKKDSKVWLWIELGGILVIKTISAVGGLTSALLLITNSAPSHAVLGRLNGLAQTLSAGGRGIGPFISGGLFTAATKLGGRGELLPFGTFAGVAAVGFALSWGIRGKGLEGDGWENDGEDGDEEEGDTEEETGAR